MSKEMCHLEECELNFWARHQKLTSETVLWFLTILRVALYDALNSTRINCTVAFSKGACHAGAAGMNVPYPRPKRKVRTNCALLSGLVNYRKKDLYIA